MWTKIVIAAGIVVLAVGVAMISVPDTDASSVPVIALNDDDARREEDSLMNVDGEDGDGDGDDTRGNDGTSGGNNTWKSSWKGDGDNTQGNDGTGGGAWSGDGDATRGNDGTSGGIDGDSTAANDGTGGGDNTYVASYSGGGGGYSGGGGGYSGGGGDSNSGGGGDT